MKYSPPLEIDGKRVVDSHTQSYSAGMKKYEDWLVGFFVGNKLSFSAVQLDVSKFWKLKKEVSIKLFGDCAFIFEFSDDDDRKQALELGSFLISNKLFTLRPWSHLIEKLIADIKTVPVWVKFFGVPLHMWNSDGLSLIASYLGIPLLADDCTINQTRLSYARICIEIDIDFDYPASIPLLIDGKFYFDLPVEYQWRPPKCDTCMVYGHNTRNCSRKLKRKWISKKVRTVHPHQNSGIEKIMSGARTIEGGDKMALGTKAINAQMTSEAAYTTPKINEAGINGTLASSKKDTGNEDGSKTSGELNSSSDIFSKIKSDKVVPDKHTVEALIKALGIKQIPLASKHVGVLEIAGSSEGGDSQGDWTVVKGKTPPNRGVNQVVSPIKSVKSVPSPKKILIFQPNYCSKTESFFDAKRLYSRNQVPNR